MTPVVVDNLAYVAKKVVKELISVANVESSQTRFCLCVHLPKGGDEHQIGCMVSVVHGICCLRAPTGSAHMSTRP